MNQDQHHAGYYLHSSDRVGAKNLPQIPQKPGVLEPQTLRFKVENKQSLEFGKLQTTKPEKSPSGKRRSAA